MIPFAAFMPQASAGGGTPAPNYATSESLTLQTTTGASLTGASMTFTPLVNTDYLFFWSQDVQSSSTSSVAASDVLVGGSSIFTTTPAVLPKEIASPEDSYSMGGIFRYQAGASPSSTVFSLLGKRGSNAATLGILNSRLSYIKLGPNDAYAESVPRQTLANTSTLTTMASLSFTPPSSGDYIVVASFNFDLGSLTNANIKVQLTDGTTSAGGAFWHPNNISDKVPAMLVLPLTGISGSKTINLQIAQPSGGSSTMGISEIRIVALRSDRFASVRTAASSANSSGTDSTYVTATGASQTFTPAAGDHLTFAAWALASTSTTASAYSQYLDDAVSVDEFIRSFGNAVSNGLPACAHRIATYAATSRTQAIQRHGEGSVSNVIQSPGRIVTIDLTGI